MTAAMLPEGKGTCPDLAKLERFPLEERIRAHVDTCDVCQLVVEVCRHLEGERDACASVEPLLAAHGDGTLNAAGINLMQRHLASCEICRELADSLPPQDAEDGGPSALPTIDPAAYQISVEVGRGGMGRVMDAYDRRIGRPVVIKELHDRSSASLAARFEREARLTARLQHPGIVPIYEIGKWDDGTPFIAMRKIEGHTLEEAIADNATVPKRLALLPSVIAACEAIAFAHSKKVIHRDLKPANVMLGTYGETIVIDWGLAKDLDADDEPLDPSDSGAGLTGIGQAVGTPAYMPPEQAHAQPTDLRSDVYALGAMLYQVLAGKPPYQAATAREVLEQVRSGPPKPIHELVTSSPPPPALISIVTKAMQRLPEDRYASAMELAEELNRFQAGQLVAAHDYSRRERIAMFVRRWRGVLVATGLALVAVAIVATISIRNVFRSRAEARTTARELLFEKGRIEQLAGNHVRALAYLYEAKQQGQAGPELELLLGRAATDLDPSVAPLNCGGDDRYLEVSRDGSLLAVACREHARVWRLKAGALGKTLPVPTPLATLAVEGSRAGFDNLAFSPDGKLIVTFGEEGIARLWQIDAMAADGKPRPYRTFAHKQPEARPKLITFATFTADSARLATTGDDGFAQIWNIADDREERSIDGILEVPGPFDASQAVRKLFGKVTPDGKLLTLTFSGAGAMFDLDTGKTLGTFHHGGTAVGGEVSPDGKLAVTCGLAGTSKVIDLATAEVLSLEGHSDAVWRCVFDAASRRVLTSSHDGTAKVWELARDRDGKPKANLVTTVSHGELIWIGRFSPDGSRFVTISPGKNMKVWDSRSGALLASYSSRGKDAQFLPDNRLAALRGDGKIQLWAPASSRISSFVPRSDSTMLGATLDGEVIATLDPSGFAAASPVTLWQAATDKPLSHPPIGPPLAYGERRVAATFVTPDPADPSKSKAGVMLLDVTGKPVGKLVDDRLAGPSSLVLSSSTTRIAAVWPDRAEVWDFERGTRLVAIPDVNRVVLSADGRRVVAWKEWDPSALDFQLPTQPVVWDVDGHAPLGTLTTIDARPIGFASDGRRIVVQELVDEVARDRLSRRQTVVLWDVDTAMAIPLLTNVGLPANVEIPPTLDATGRWLTTIANDRTVSVWDTSTGSLKSWFSGEAYQMARVDSAGSLLVAIGDYGRAAMIVSAADGRVLARHQLDHEGANVSPEHFRAPSATAWWTQQGRAIAIQSRSFATWNATNPYSALRMAQLVKKYVPWRIENGHLAPIRSGKIFGTVTRNGQPVAGAKIEVQRRRPADVSVKPVNWASMTAQYDIEKPTTTDESGRFAIEDLVPGGEYEYLVTATHGGSSAKIESYADPEESSIELELR